MAHAQTKIEPSESSAEVVRVVSIAGGTLRVTAASGPAEPWQVACAIPDGVALSAGDQVVVLPSSQGPIAIARLRSAEPTEHALSDGARVKLDATTLSVERADGTPLFRYEAGAHGGKVTLAAESLELAARAGDLSLSAAGTIRLEGRALHARMQMPGHSTTFALDPRRAQLSADELSLSGQSVTLEAGKAVLKGDEVQSTFKRAVIKLERLESVVDTAVSRARNVYQTVQELLQQQAGSLRTIVAGTAQLKAREVTQRAEEGFKVRADKIHLG